VSHESIYRSLFVQTRGGLRKELTAHLRTKRATRRPAGHVNPMGAVFARTFSTSPNVLPKLPTAVPGHWESPCFCQAAGASAGRGGSW